MYQHHKPQPKLHIITPIPENAPFTEQSVKDAFDIFKENPDDILEYNLLKTNWDLNQGLFTWSFDQRFYSSLILVFTAKGQFLNEDINTANIQYLLEGFLNDPDMRGDGTWDFTFNDVSLIITIKHDY